MSGAVVFDGVWKSYLRGERANALRDLVPNALRAVNPFGRGGARRRDAFWALNDVSFEVLPGQALGIIGPNGAGKSTVLKLASGILRPDRGRVEVRGRVGALIELVAGFHSELTGRENVYLQGAMMGMRRSEIDARFDQIVDFSGVGPFLDTPVKRYSSGMHARLGFSIAAHMDPDVLIIDEVLSVGDAAFQRKAAERMRTIVERDIPVLVVSHQLDRVLELCARAILLMGGRVATMGSAVECVDAYVGDSADDYSRATSPITIDGAPEPTPSDVASGERIRVKVIGGVSDVDAAKNVTIGLRIREVGRENVIFELDSASEGIAFPLGRRFTFEVSLEMNVAAGLYRIRPVAWDAGRRNELVRGPSSIVRVRGAGNSRGPVFLDPHLQFVMRD